MGTLIVNSLIASVVLTALINVIPRLFPGSSAEDRIRDLFREPPESLSAAPSAPELGDDQQPRFRVWFPWKSMLVASILITIILNLIAFFS